MSTDTPNSAPLSLPQRVLVAVDASKASQRAVDYLKYVVPAGAAVRFVSVVDTPRAYMLPHTFAPSNSRRRTPNSSTTRRTRSAARCSRSAAST